MTSEPFAVHKVDFSVLDLCMIQAYMCTIIITTACRTGKIYNCVIRKALCNWLWRVPFICTELLIEPVQARISKYAGDSAPQLGLCDLGTATCQRCSLPELDLQEMGYLWISVARLQPAWNRSPTHSFRLYISCQQKGSQGAQDTTKQWE